MTTSLVHRMASRIANRYRDEPDPGTRGGRTSRRGFLGSAVMVGAALAVDPWGFITKPTSAYASACGTDWTCSSGYSVFCCTLNNGKNTCPPNTFVGGWWKADRSSYCGGKARYYIDCNALPGHHFQCRCNNTTCDQRLVACNVFRYGQCNTDIASVTAVVCRQVSCTPPWQLYPGSCGRSSATDNNTAGHTAPCLTEANTFPPGEIYPPAASSLAAGHSLPSGSRLTSPDRRTTALMRRHGDLAIMNSDGLQWSSGMSNRSPGSHLELSRTGDLRIVDEQGRVRWNTFTSGHSDTRVELRNDGNLVITEGSRMLWSSHTDDPYHRTWVWRGTTDTENGGGTP